MPTTLLGVAILLAALAPGLVYATIRESRFPRLLRTPFRETASVVLASAVSLLLVVIALGVIRLVRPDRTPDVGAIVRDPGAYLREAYLSVALWSAGGLAAACVVAAAAARWLPEYQGAINSRSAWCLAFEDERSKGRLIHVGCEFTDGTYLAGYLKRHSTEPEETGDRELTLEGPLTYVTGSEDDSSDGALAVNLALVPARHIKFMTVSFPPIPANEDP